MPQLHKMIVLNFPMPTEQHPEASGHIEIVRDIYGDGQIAVHAWRGGVEFVRVSEDVHLRAEGVFLEAENKAKERLG